MTNFRKSVPQPAPGAGAPKPKKPNVTIVFVDDILVFPPSDTGGVKMLGNIILKDGARMERVYATIDTQKASHTFEGDPDKEGFLKAFEGSHPGDELAINEYIQNTIGVGVVVIYDVDCNTGLRKVMGTPCNPLYLKPEFMDDKDGVAHMLKFEQRMRDRFVAKFYEGDLMFAENYVSDNFALAITDANGPVYRLPSSPDEDTDVTVASMTQEHKKVVSLIGSGGENPATLSGGVSGPVTVLLSNGTPWVALKDATINLQVFDAAATTYLIELSRG